MAVYCSGKASKHPRLLYVGGEPDYSFQSVKVLRDGAHICNAVLHDGGCGGVMMQFADGTHKHVDIYEGPVPLLLSYKGPDWGTLQNVPGPAPKPTDDTKMLEWDRGLRSSPTLGAWTHIYDQELKA